MSFIYDRLPFNLRRDTRRLLEQCLARHLKPLDIVLDVGCGTKPFASFMQGRVAAYVGVDRADGFYGPDSVDMVGTAYDVPVSDAHADVVLSSQVIEHLEEPDRAFREFNRILKPNGLLVLSFPMTYPLHAEPYDFFRYTEYGCRELCRRNGFEVLEVHKLTGFWRVFGDLMEKYFSPFRNTVLNKIAVVDAFLWLAQAAFFIVHTLEGAALRLVGKDPRGFRGRWVLNYVVIARKL